METASENCGGYDGGYRIPPHNYFEITALFTCDIHVAGKDIENNIQRPVPVVLGFLAMLYPNVPFTVNCGFLL